MGPALHRPSHPRVFTLSLSRSQGGVVLGADTRSTAGSTVADKNCEKIHYLAPQIYCCGAGTAADTEHTTAQVARSLELHRFETGRPSRVISAHTLLRTHLYKHQGHIGAALVLGGWDPTGAHLFSVYPHGSTDALPFATMGSGSLAAMGVFEDSFSEGMTREEAEALVTRAILSGITNDLGSGSNVDLCTIDQSGAVYQRNVKVPDESKTGFKPIFPIVFKPGGPRSLHIEATRSDPRRSSADDPSPSGISEAADALGRVAVAAGGEGMETG